MQSVIYITIVKDDGFLDYNKKPQYFTAAYEFPKLTSF